MSVNEIKLTKAEKEFEVRGTRDPSSRTFVIGNEDHTLGNAIRHVLMQNAQVGFAGYSVPHPSEPVVHVRVQTVENSGLTATQALKDASVTLSEACDFLLEQVETMCPEVKEDRLKIEKFLEETAHYEEEDDEEVDDDEDMGDEY